jgi:O-antigen ligase
MAIVFYEFLVQGEKERTIALWFTFVGILGFLGYFLIIYREQAFHFSLSVKTRAGTYFGNQNDVASYLAFSVMVCFYFCFLRKHYFAIIPFALGIYEIVLTGSISNMLSVFLALFICGLVALPNKGKSILVISSAVGLIAFFLLLQLPVFEYFRNRIFGMFTEATGVITGSTDPSMAQRWELAVEALHLFIQRPLFGFGFDGTTSNTYAAGVSHNNYVELLADFGMFGFVPYTILSVLPLAKLAKKRNGFSLFCWSTAIYMAIFQFFLVTFSSKVYYLFFAFIYAEISEGRKDASASKTTLEDAQQEQENPLSLSDKTVAKI